MATLTPYIYSRKEWYAAAEQTQYMDAIPVNPLYIIVHHSARNQPDRTDGAEMRMIQLDHQNQQWGDIGYNFGIGRFSSIMEGRSLNYYGAHCKDTIIYANRNSIGVCVFVNSETSNVNSDQFDSLISLLGYLCKKYNIPTQNIKGHKDYSSTACPGANIYNQMTNIRSKVSSLLGNSIITPPPSSKKYLNLNPSVSSWKVYPTNVAPVVGNQCGYLAPAQYGGLSYEIVGNPQTDVYTIITDSFGKVNIYAPRDNDSSITTSPVYNLTNGGGSGSGSGGQYLNLNPSVSSWRVYPTNVAPVIGNECGYLAPAQYGGISYQILGKPQTDVYTIKTSSFGTVNIYAPRDNDSSITNSPLY